MKKFTSIIISLMLTVAMLLSMSVFVSAADTASKPTAGADLTAKAAAYVAAANAATAEAPAELKIESADDLLAFQLASVDPTLVGTTFDGRTNDEGKPPEKGTFLNCVVTLECDIVLNEGNAADWANAAPAIVWMGIGTRTDNYNKDAGQIARSSCFAGTFDGKGHSVSGVYMTATAVGKAQIEEVGFFNNVGPATIKNLVIKNSYYTSLKAADAEKTVNYVGGIVGANVHGAYEGKVTTVENCGFVDSTINAVNNAAGIMPRAHKASLIKGCYVKNSTIIGLTDVGGIMVQLQSATTITECAVWGNLSGVRAGGICALTNGSAEGAVISDCVNFATVKGPSGAGAVLGKAAAAITVTRCVNLGTVTDAYGCIVGATSATSITATDNYTTGDSFYFIEDPTGPSITKIDADKVKGSAAKLYLTALDFAKTDAAKADWTAIVNDFAVPTAIATALDLTEDTTTPEPLPGDNDNEGGNTSGGNTSGGNTSGDNTAGGNTSGDNTSGDNTAGGNTSNDKTDDKTDNNATTETPEEEKGCGGLVGTGAIAVLAVAGLACGLVAKKKED